MSDFVDIWFILAYMNLGARTYAPPPCPPKHFPTFLTTPVGVGFRPYPKEECMLFCVCVCVCVQHHNMQGARGSTEKQAHKGPLKLTLRERERESVCVCDPTEPGG